MIAKRLPQNRFISDMIAKKRVVPLGGARFSSGKSHIVSAFLPFFSDEYNKQEVFVFP
jgi:hypothetical protein